MLRSRRRGLIPILLAGALTLAATAAAGSQPSAPRVIADSAFTPVTIDAKPLLGSTVHARLRGEARRPTRTPDPGPIAEPWVLGATAGDRARPSLPVPPPIAVQRPSSGTSAGTTSLHHSISGRASWYCAAGLSACTSSHPDTTGFNAYAAAGPRLRAALGPNWRGMVVTVDGIRVTLIDWCQCYEGQPSEKLLDLYHDVYLRTGSPVTIRW